ncbi:hypothetical protein B0H13DRAFT_2313701 [Mycena leptocephala]|nr:hypothetical protein B0H13DRAFT_2313701 [Mycena leptocephala]
MARILLDNWLVMETIFRKFTRFPSRSGIGFRRTCIRYRGVLVWRERARHPRDLVSILQARGGRILVISGCGIVVVIRSFIVRVIFASVRTISKIFICVVIPKKISSKYVWNVDQPNSRKRTSSTVEVSDKAKKPRKSVSIVESDAEEDVPEPKTKTSLTKRKYAAPPIPIESDSEPAASAKLPKSKLASKVKQSAEKAAAVPIAKSFKAADVAKPKVSAKAKLPPAKIIAESASEASSDENEDNASDSDIGDFEDANDEEFLVEVPRVVVSKKAVAVPAYNSEHEDMQMSDASDAGQLFDSDHESIEIYKPKGKSSKIQSDAEDELPDAPPRRAPREDDDIALHEAIANVLVSIPMGHRSRRSSTASWSSGHDLRVPDTDPDDEDDEDNMGPPAAPKPRKVSAARQKQADLEKSHIRAAPVPKTAHQVKLEERTTFDAPPPRAETTWHPSAQIVYPAPGKKDILLNSQTEELQGVLRHSIGLIKTGLIFEDGYPAIISRAGFARSYLISSAETIPNAKHVRERLGLDLKYAAILADILLDRINIQRGDTKRTASGMAPGLFQFAGLSPSKTKELIEKLLKDHRYIFPVDPQTGRLMTELPFMHPAMSGVIKEAVFTRNFKANNMHLFISTSKKHPKQLELPDAMVALVATALYASLVERESAKPSRSLRVPTKTPIATT